MKQPKLRFKADDGSSFPDLKEKRLNDVCEYNKGQSVGVNYVGTENMKQDFSGVNDLDSRNEVKGVVYNNGDTLMSNIRPYLKKTWKADVNGVCSTDVLVFHPTDINSDYLYRNISSEKFISYVMTAAKGTKMPRGDKEHIMNYDIQVPCLLEQQKIASLFTELDVLIQSAEKELEGYRELKQGMLQKMFPKKGETVPEIRFPEFSGDWKLCKLGDIGSVSMCRRIFKGQTTESGDIPFYKIGTFGGKADAYISKDLFEEYKTKYPFPKIGDILISASGSIGRTVEFNGESAYFQDSNIVWLNHDERVDNSFLKQFYSIVKWSGLEGSAIKRLYNDNILKTEISLPSLDEQKKIGNYFSNLDNLIASQQQELDGYKELKKGLLQQMFC